MIKSELVARLTARYPHLYHRDVERIVTTVLDNITKALSDGHRVELRGFGAFSVKVRPSRMGRNPRTGEPVSVGEKRAPFFRTGQEMWTSGFPSGRAPGKKPCLQTPSSSLSIPPIWITPAIWRRGSNPMSAG